LSNDADRIFLATLIVFAIWNRKYDDLYTAQPNGHNAFCTLKPRAPIRHTLREHQWGEQKTGIFRQFNPNGRIYQRLSALILGDFHFLSLARSLILWPEKTGRLLQRAKGRAKLTMVNVFQMAACWSMMDRNVFSYFRENTAAIDRYQNGAAAL